MLEELKEKVCAANLDLCEKGVVIYTWGMLVVYQMIENIW